MTGPVGKALLSLNPTNFPTHQRRPPPQTILVPPPPPHHSKLDPPPPPTISIPPPSILASSTILPLYMPTYLNPYTPLFINHSLPILLTHAPAPHDSDYDYLYHYSVTIPVIYLSSIAQILCHSSFEEAKKKKRNQAKRRVKKRRPVPKYTSNETLPVTQVAFHPTFLFTFPKTSPKQKEEERRPSITSAHRCLLSTSPKFYFQERTNYSIPLSNPQRFETTRQPKMPYNTRRKSLSLPSLGIHVPVSNAARAAAAAALANRQKSPTALSSASSHSSSSSSSLSAHSASSSSQSTPTFSPRSPTDRSDQQPAQTSASAARKTKRPHALVDAPSSGDSSTSAHKRRQLVSNNHTPPPSPGFDRAVSIEMDIDDDHSHAADHKIDLASIHDDIVAKVIIRLQATNNRPHIVKELAGILIKQLKIVEQ